MVWPHVTLAAMAARHVRRPVRLTVTRGQMFSSCGHREEQEQHISLGATRDGKLTAIRHRKISVTSPFDDWAEPAFGVASRLYASPAIVATSTQEFGTGTPTVLTQVAADALGVELRDVRVEFGDTSLPGTGSPVGSNSAMMISAAVHNAGVAVRDQLIALAAADPASPLHGADPATITAASGRLMLSGDPGTGETYAALMSRHRMTDAEAIGSWDPPPPGTPYGLLTFGAQFAKVAVDADLGIIRVRHLAGAFAPGRILNPRTARSQLMGGMLWGMSQALLEGNHMDTARAGWAATSLGEYLVPVNADAPDVDVDLIEVDDHVTGPLGVKGVGEIGQVGSSAAIANAVYHATGYRVRELPIAIEHLLAHLTAEPAATARSAT